MKRTILILILPLLLLAGTAAATDWPPPAA